MVKIAKLQIQTELFTQLFVPKWRSMRVVEGLPGDSKLVGMDVVDDFIELYFESEVFEELKDDGILFRDVPEIQILYELIETQPKDL